jgi:hypothetical protein
VWDLLLHLFYEVFLQQAIQIESAESDKVEELGEYFVFGVELGILPNFLEGGFVDKLHHVETAVLEDLVGQVVGEHVGQDHEGKRHYLLVRYVPGDQIAQIGVETQRQELLVDGLAFGRQIKDHTQARDRRQGNGLLFGVFVDYELRILESIQGFFEVTGLDALTLC